MGKRSMLIVVSLLLIVSLFAGCAKPAADPVPVSKDAETDVLVIGGGGAGLVSAITAAQNGAKVVLVEKMPAVGGNTIISATGITASDTKLHEEAGMPFTKEDHFIKTMETGKGLPDEKLVRLLVDNSNDAYEWLVSLGMSFKIQSPEEPFWLIPTEGFYGALFVNAFLEEAAKYENIEVRLDTKATELITVDGKVVGAKVAGKDGEYVINANSVVLATGGLNNAPEMIAEFNSNYKGINTEMTTPGATGDGIKMALAVGAQLKDMDLFQMRPLSSNGNWYKEVIISEEGKGGILVNQSAERFVDETMKPWDLGAEILKQKDALAYIVFDEDVYNTKDGKKAFEKGKGVKADTIEELATQLGLDSATLKATVDAYNAGQDPFNRKSLGKVSVGPFYGVKTLPSSHYTMGGVSINENAQVLNAEGNAIEGLYAAGEVIGGLYGAGRVAGNNTLDDVVFGKIAGKNAAGK